jgi:hypothetical protein
MRDAHMRAHTSWHARACDANMRVHESTRSVRGRCSGDVGRGGADGTSTEGTAGTSSGGRSGGRWRGEDVQGRVRWAGQRPVGCAVAKLLEGQVSRQECEGVWV